MTEDGDGTLGDSLHRAHWMGTSRAWPARLLVRTAIRVVGRERNTPVEGDKLRVWRRWRLKKCVYTYMSAMAGICVHTHTRACGQGEIFNKKCSVLALCTKTGTLKP